MQRYNIYVPKAKGAPQGITIADLIPIGRENAISRKMLVALCVDQGLVTPTIKDKDRAMRLLIQHDRTDYTILNLSDGDGYYRPSAADLLYLQQYIRQEEKRAKAVFRSLKQAKRLYEDYKKGRIQE